MKSPEFSGKLQLRISDFGFLYGHSSLAAAMLPGYILLPGCSGKPARQNKNRMSVISCFEEFAARLRDFIASHATRPGAADQRIFESLALQLFALQFENNLAYR